MEKQKLADILTPDIVGVSPGTLISETMGLMTRNNISCVVVLDQDRPVGIVTERNIVKLVAAEWDRFHDGPVREMMSSPVVTAPADMDIFGAYNLLSTQGMRHLVVADGDQRPVGVVTLSNIVEHLTYESFVVIKRVSQVMTRVVFTVNRDAGLRKALIEMSRKSMSCIVVTDGRQPLGIITERDASHLLIEHPDLSRLTVAEVMSDSLETVHGDTSLSTAVAIMKEKKLRRLVVIDSKGRIEGLTTQSDIVKGLEGKYIQALSEIIREKDSVIQSTTRDLAEKTAYLDNILHSAIDYGIIAINLNHRVVYFNPGAEHIFGVGKDAVLGLDIGAVHQNDETLLTQVKFVLNSIGKGGREAFLIERCQGDKRQSISARASGIWDKQERLVGFFLMVRDITKRRQAEEELKRVHEELELRVVERTRQLSKAMNGAVEAMALTVEMRDPYTSGHQRRVADLAAAIAREMGLSREKVEGVYMAGVIHDIGKIRVPSGILCHPGRLSEAEFGILQPHPAVGYDILKGIEFPWPLAEIVLQHHERLDGSGYPHGLKNGRILLKARILAVADVVEAMSSHRPYRPALGVEHALREISAKRGTCYEPAAVDACVELFTNKKYQFPSHFREESESL
ncbi:MAG: CBS domain-containing protein [Desulfobacterales bacterium]|nr:CBS domain-containing protein [Desulfobacterales bacterium]